jgi:hypothetical protein
MAEFQEINGTKIYWDVVGYDAYNTATDGKSPHEVVLASFKSAENAAVASLTKYHTAVVQMAILMPGKEVKTQD